jgi:glycosyltransferase involved in cell wall biosynthesis
MKPPTISIVTPSFNQVQHLAECLDSVLGQGYPGLEYLVVDGGSSDGSVEVLKAVGSRLAYWVSEPDRGQAAAVNKGWARAKGQVLGWINSDDLLRPEALTQVATAYMTHPQAAVIYGDVEEINDLGQHVRTKNMVGFGLRSLLLGKNMGQPGVFITRRAYDQQGGLDESLHYALDFDYFLRAWLSFPPNDFHHVPSVLAASRLWGRSKSAQQAARFGAEYRSVLDATFRRTDLPPEIRGLEGSAYSRSFLFRQARLYFETGDVLRGWLWLWRSILREPDWIKKAQIGWFGLRGLVARERGEA